MNRTKPKKSRAIRDIPVYKILTYDPTKEEYTSPIMEYVYEFGKEEESILNLPKKATICELSLPVTIYKIDKGLHSYRKTSLKISDKQEFSSFTEITIETQNLDTHWTMLVDKLYQSRFRRYVLCSAHIPKGAFYYLNEWGEYVSDTLIIDKVLDVNKELKELKKK